MFQKICIKSKQLANREIDISFLIDAMVFYKKVVVLVHKEELITRLKYVGEDFLKELIKSGRLDLSANGLVSLKDLLKLPKKADKFRD